MTLKEKAESKAKEYQVADVCRVWNGGCPNVRHASMEMFEWTKQELIDKACEWLENISLEDMVYKYNDFDTSEDWYKFINDFRKAIED